MNEIALKIWLTLIVILTPKDFERPNIHRLKIINTYESEYNLILKYFRPKQGTKTAETNKWLGTDQTRGRKNMSAVKLEQLMI